MPSVVRAGFNSAVMEDHERPQGERLVHFGASVFVTDEFVQEVREFPRPGLSDIILDRFHAGRSPSWMRPRFAGATPAAASMCLCSMPVWLPA